MILRCSMQDVCDAMRAQVLSGIFFKGVPVIMNNPSYMNNQRGDAGVSMLAVMVVMMLGFWLFSGHSGDHGGGHHMMGGDGTNNERSIPGNTVSETPTTTVSSPASHK